MTATPIRVAIDSSGLHATAQVLDGPQPSVDLRGADENALMTAVFEHATAQARATGATVTLEIADERARDRISLRCAWRSTPTRTCAPPLSRPISTNRPSPDLPQQFALFRVPHRWCASPATLHRLTPSRHLTRHRTAGSTARAPTVGPQHANPARPRFTTPHTTTPSAPHRRRRHQASGAWCRQALRAGA